MLSVLLNWKSLVSYTLSLPWPYCLLPVPDISLVITSSGTPVVGEDYFFICTVTNTRGIGAVISIGIVIDGDSSMLMPLPVTSFLLPLSPLTLSDAGIYQCSVEVDSPYITNTIALMTAPEEQTIRVTSKGSLPSLVTHSWPAACNNGRASTGSAPSRDFSLGLKC